MPHLTPAIQIMLVFFGLSEVNWAGSFMIVNPPNFMGFKVEEDPQDFMDRMEKIVKVMHISNTEGLEFVVYLLKKVAY